MTNLKIKSSGGTVLQEVSYRYDPLDRRIGAGTDPDGAGGQPMTWQWTAYDGQNPYADFDNSGSLTNRYLYGDAVDQLFARFSASGTAAWYLTDQLGSVRDIASTSGSVIDHIKYQSFGSIVNESNPSSGDRFKYTAREFDSTTKQYFNRARYYDAAIARFTSEDPIGLRGGDTNVYRYVGNSPTLMVDPSGAAGTPAQNRSPNFNDPAFLASYRNWKIQKGYTGDAEIHDFGGWGQDGSRGVWETLVTDVKAVWNSGFDWSHFGDDYATYVDPMYNNGSLLDYGKQVGWGLFGVGVGGLAGVAVGTGIGAIGVAAGSPGWCAVLAASLGGGTVAGEVGSTVGGIGGETGRWTGMIGATLFGGWGAGKAAETLVDAASKAAAEAAAAHAQAARDLEMIEAAAEAEETAEAFRGTVEVLKQAEMDEIISGGEYIELIRDGIAHAETQVRWWEAAMKFWDSLLPWSPK